MAQKRPYQHEPLRVPDRWSGQDRALVLQIDRLFDELYNKLSELKDLRDAEEELKSGKARYIYLNASVQDTWEKIYAEINKLDVAETAVMTSEATASLILTNGTRQAKLYGTISKRGPNQFNFIWRGNGNNVIIANLTDANAAGTDMTYSERIITSEITDLQTDVTDLKAERQYGRRLTKAIPANTNTCRIDYPAGCWLTYLSLPGTSRQWLGLVYCGSDGAVNVEQINSKTGITVTGGTAGQSRITVTFTYTSDTTLHFVSIPLRSNTFPSFH